MKKLMQVLISCSVLLMYVESISAQDLYQWMHNDSSDVNVIATYPETIRDAVFESATYPESVVRLSEIQMQSRDQFQKIVAPFSRSEQQQLWDITRYDDLIGQLVRGGKKTGDEVTHILENYPVSVRPDAFHYSLNHYETLSQIYAANEHFNQTFDQWVAEYPSNTQSALRELIKTPELISLLNNNMRLTVLLGDWNRHNPVKLRGAFYELNLILARQKAADLEEWKNSIESDPQAVDELKKSAEEYAAEYTYYDEGTEDVLEENPTVIEHYVYYPYPYWCGFPTWYDYEFWHPYPWWYQSGFYVHDGVVIFISMPSNYFLHWHFWHHPHYHDYPHLTNHYLNYYYGSRRWSAGNNKLVQQWVGENRDYVPADFIENQAKRVDRIRDLGKFENNFRKYKNDNSNTNVRKLDFMKEHAKEYPYLINEKPTVPVDKTKQNPVVKPGFPQKEPKENVRPEPSYKQPVDKAKPGVEKSRPANEKPVNAPKPVVKPSPQPQPARPKSNTSPNPKPSMKDKTTPVKPPKG